jgi:hypothetical protein
LSGGVSEHEAMEAYPSTSAQASGAPGFKAGYWTWPTGEGELNVRAMIIFDSEENARAAGDRVSANFSQLENRDDVTLDGVEVREVVASA